MEKPSDRYLTLMRQGSKKIVHQEWWSNPDAETYMTGIDYYERPRDCRILTYGTKDDIRKMVERMVETGKMCGGYFMCIGNHIPWNVPGENIKYYLDYSDKLAWR